MVAYLYIDRDAMYFVKVRSSFEAPPHGVGANRRNHVRLAAGDVRLNCRTITLDLTDQRLRVAQLVVDAHVPAAEVVQVQSGAVEPLAESLAAAADERNALAALILARALTQNVEVGGNRPVGVYDGAGRRRGTLMPLMEPAGAGPSFTLGFGRRRAGIGISYTLKEWDADYAGLSVKCVTGSRVIWSVASVVDEKSRLHSMTAGQ